MLILYVLSLIIIHGLSTHRYPYKIFEGIQVYNILDGSCPEYLKGFIKLFDHVRNTRNSNNTNILKVPKTNLKLGEKSFKFRASALWNGLNINFKNAGNIDVFKKRLIKELRWIFFTVISSALTCQSIIMNSFHHVSIVLIVSMYHACAYLSLYIFFNSVVHYFYLMAL